MIDRVRMGLPIDKIANQVLAMRDLWESLIWKQVEDYP